MPLKYTKNFLVNFSDILIFSATIFLCLLISQLACLFGALLLEWSFPGPLDITLHNTKENLFCWIKGLCSGTFQYSGTIFSFPTRRPFVVLPQLSFFHMATWDHFFSRTVSKFSKAWMLNQNYNQIQSVWNFLGVIKYHYTIVNILDTYLYPTWRI